MERNEINEFIENLREEKNISESDASDLKESLEISARDIEPARLATFIKAVKDEINAPASTVFSERGVNLENIKVIASSIAKGVKKQQEIERFSRNRDVEQSETEKEFTEILEQIAKEKKYEIDETEVLKNLDEILAENANIPKGEAIDTAVRRTRGKSARKANKENKERASEILGKNKAERCLNFNAMIDDVYNDIITSETPQEREKYLDEISGMLADNFVGNYDAKDEYLGKFFSPLATSPKLLCDQETREIVEHMYDDINRHVMGFNTFKQNYTGTVYEEPAMRQEVSVGVSAIIKGALGRLSNNKFTKALDVMKADSLIKSKAKIDQELAKLDKAIEECSQSDKGGDQSKLPKLVVAKIEQARLRKETCQNFTSLAEKSKAQIKTDDQSMYRKNTLLTDAAKKVAISNMYFDQGLSAVEIYEIFKKEGLIRPDSHLIPDDVIDVILEEAKKYGVKDRELIQLQKDEREIEKNWALSKAYRTIANSVRDAKDNRFEAEVEKASSLKSKHDGIVSVLKLKNKDLREKVSSERSKAEKRTNWHGIKLEQIVTSGKEQARNLWDKFKMTSVIRNKGIGMDDITQQTQSIMAIYRDSSRDLNPNKDDEEIIE